MFDWIDHENRSKEQREAGYIPRKPADAYLARSAEWSVSYRNTDQDTLSVPVSIEGPHSFVSLDYEPGEPITIRSARAVSSVKVSPQRLGITPEINDGIITFTPPSPGHFVIEINNTIESALTVSVMPRIPKPENITHYFKAGLHKLDFLTLEDDDTLYLEDGAVIEAIPPHDPEPCLNECDWAGQKKYRNFITAAGKKNIRISGHGIIDTSKLDWHARSPLVFNNCENVTIEGVTVIGTPEWTLISSGCNGFYVNDVRFFGHFENSDGIDLCQSQNIEIKNSFLRTGDDAICVKSFAEPPTVGGRNINVHDCVIWNDKVRCLGIACETRSNIDNVTFRDCDIIHSLATWTEALGSLCIIVCDSGTISDIQFENITVEDEKQYVINCMIMKDRWSNHKDAGHIKNITYKNITAPENSRCNFKGFDGEHLVENILIDGYFAGGRRLTENEMNINKNEFVKNIEII